MLCPFIRNCHGWKIWRKSKVFYWVDSRFNLRYNSLQGKNNVCRYANKSSKYSSRDCSWRRILKWHTGLNIKNSITEFIKWFFSSKNEWDIHIFLLKIDYFSTKVTYFCCRNNEGHNPLYVEGDLKFNWNTRRGLF